MSLLVKMSSFSFSSILLLLLPLLLPALFSTFGAEAQPLFNPTKVVNYSVSAIYIFGDSTVDSGNNDYIATPFKSNFPPYGQDFPNHIPTGRFTNGRLATDFIASYVGVKDFVPPYLDETLGLEDLMTGVSFASAGSGFDPLTAQITSVIKMSKQLEYFKEYKTRLEEAIGKERTENLIQKSVAIISAGTNDFVFNYLAVPIRRQGYSLEDYQQFLMQNLREFIQGLWEQGVRKIAVVGLPPMGCLPVVITFNSQASAQGGCVESYSAVARDYNLKLQAELAFMQMSVAFYGGRIMYADIYQPITDMIQDYKRFGFEEWRSGCCGTGLMEASFMCNPNSLVCSDVSKYLFWDSVHPTERAYYYIFSSLYNTIDHLVRD
ncbi:PREDICTED: GDSL esterase/lipase At5g45960-like [Nelumbo nucifera]|uniref:GDSL esterase/lipase At5g45960-like n=1 Tax=Nelumbo nucifera TaxID=4432 RepID=A0A1U8BNY8_NELNU|nr:PREDICTED: GDSL esterase/lipase At5g45960-like [Nelumbo nucifera]